MSESDKSDDSMDDESDCEGEFSVEESRDREWEICWAEYWYIGCFYKETKVWTGGAWVDSGKEVGDGEGDGLNLDVWGFC